MIIKNFKFPDHYIFSNKDIRKIKNVAKNLKAKIITTEKDYNRLSDLDSEDIEYLKVDLKISNEKKLINFLNDKI